VTESDRLRGKTLGIVHAALWVAPIANRYTAELLPGVKVMTICDDSLEEEFLRIGHVPPHNYYKAATYIQFLEQAGANAVLFGCSTMNRTVEYVQPLVSIPVQQIDAPMMEEAVRIGSRIGMLATLPTTIPSSTRLLKQKADAAGKAIQITTVLRNDAFQKLQEGDRRAHNDILLGEIDRLSQGVDVIVLAQVSMSLLDDEVKGARVPVLNSGRTGFQRMRQILEAL
jgi:aspartate/glutamate racemase